MKEKIGFIGLGIMGKPMAKNLLKSGYPLTVYDIVSESVEEIVSAGAYKGLSPKDVAERTEIIITMLPNSPQVKEVILGENGVIEGIQSGKTVIDMSSIAPMISQEISSKLIEKGVSMLDAPVSGGEPKAIEGTLAIMVGGSEETFIRVIDVLKAMGSSVVLIGGIGSGNVTKLANQIIVALNIAAISEAMVFVRKAGVDPERVYKAIRSGLAGSIVMDAKVPMMLNRNFKPGFRIELHIKDLMNAIDTAQKVEVPLPLSSRVLEMMQVLKVEGKGNDDHSVLIEYYEKLAQIEVKKGEINA